MKNLNFLTNSFQKITLMVVMLLSTMYAFAQETADEIVSTTTTTTTEEWYTNPLYLVIGGVVLIIIIALITRGNGRKS